MAQGFGSLAALAALREEDIPYLRLPLVQQRLLEKALNCSPQVHLSDDVNRQSLDYV